MKTWMLIIFNGVMLPCIISGCVALDGELAPDVAVPAHWADEKSPALKTETRFSLQDWWAGFDDPVFTRLIADARRSNRNLQSALLRIEEARAARGVVGSQFFPKVNLGGQFARSSSSETVDPLRGGVAENFYSGGFTASWEIDVFGRVRRSFQAADYAVDATKAVFYDVMVILDSEVALNYIDYRTFAERIRLARQNIETQRQSLQLARDRFDAGLVPELDVFQAQTNLARTRAVLPQLRALQEQARNRLAVLLGTYPPEVGKILADRSDGIPKPDRSLGVGLPADLLRTRPDIRAAERTLAAQVAEIGVARTELFPQFNVTGDLVLESRESSEFFRNDSAAWSLVPNFTWRLFTAGEISNKIKQAKAQAGQALADYENTVQNAVAEVETSMVAVEQEWNRLAALEEATAAAGRSVESVNTLYEQGLVNFQNLLDTERTLYQSQDAAAESRGNVARNYVQLIKALGGGTDYGQLPGQNASEMAADSQ